MQARLWQVGKLMPRGLSRHMEAHLVTPMLFCSSWILTAFAADFPIFFSSRVMDVVLADRYLEPIMKVGSTWCFSSARIRRSALMQA